MKISCLLTKAVVLLVLMLTAVMLIPSVSDAAKETARKAEVKEEAAQGNAFEAKSYDLGLEIGAWFPGTIDVEGYGAGKDMSILFRAFADAYLMPKFAVGAYFNYSSATVEDVDGSFTEFGITLKPRFLLSPVVAVKPGLNIGYRVTSVEGMDSIDGMGLNLSCEVQYMMDNDYIVFGDFGFLTQPTGGNEDANVTWAPIIYIAGGICF